MESTAKTYKFIGKVLPDGHLSIPEEVAKDTGMEFDVTLSPVNDVKKSVLLHRKGLIEKKGSILDIKLDAERIAKAIKKTFNTDNIDDIIDTVRR
jgi:hypothetical protein